MEIEQTGAGVVATRNGQRLTYDEIPGMSGMTASSPDSLQRQDPTTAPVPAASDPAGHVPFRALRQQDEPAATVPHLTRDVDAWADALMALAARLSPGPRGRAGGATLERSISVARVTESTVVACARDLQRLAVQMENDLRQRDRLTLDLLDTQRELQQVRVDLVDSRAQEQRARQGTSHDPLTGLPNRTSFEQRARRALAWHEHEARELGLLYIDVDEFESINHLYGRAVGDELLKMIAARLTDAVCKEDWVGRNGGDEFLCMLMEIQSEQQLVSTAQRLYDAVGAPCQIGRLTLSVTPSIGIALYPHHGTTVEALLESADAAMLWAKKHRLGHAFFQPVAGELKLAIAGR
jgi:diguanylate cyclase (GGDEF)-like protein